MGLTPFQSDTREGEVTLVQLTEGCTNPSTVNLAYYGELRHRIFLRNVRVFIPGLMDEIRTFDSRSNCRTLPPGFS